MTSLNCFACHQRDDVGGVTPFLADSFRTRGEDLEDEGRFPPRLTGVGRKLTLHASQTVLRGRGSVRPYMITRMPDFGELHARELSELLALADHDPGVRPTPRDGRENEVGRNMWGRALIGTEGLSCITCHPLNGRKSLGIQALDLATAPGRLQPEWFRDYLLDPARFRPGTRMPAFWPEGRPTLKGFGGSSERQIDSLWVYLNELEQSRLPAGLEKQGEFELTPTNRPIVFRTFMEHAGLHAIAIGYPEGVHAAFDSKELRWAVFWKGRFLDAESTWDDRFTPLAKPLGEHQVLLPPGTGLTVDRGENADARRTFQGYRLDPAGSPTMLYQLGPWRVQDRLQPAPNAAQLTQILDIDGPDGELDYRFAPPKPAGVVVQTPAGTAWGDRLKVHVTKGETTRVILKWTW